MSILGLSQDEFGDLLRQHVRPRVETLPPLCLVPLRGAYP